jgi:hypothetical protein
MRLYGKPHTRRWLALRGRKSGFAPVEKHFQEGSAELQIPFGRLRAGSRLRSPGFPVEVGGFLELHAPFLSERRTRCRVRCCVTGNPGRDDKGKGDGSMESGCWTEGVFHLLGWAAGP